MSSISKALLAVAAASMIAGAPASAMTVQPIVIDLNPAGRGASRTITVENTNADRLPVELKIESLSFADDGLKVEGPSKDLAVFPAQAVIGAGRTQAFRLQWVGGPIDSSRSYYVTVGQAPVTLPQGNSAIQVLYNFRVLVSVSPSRGSASLRVESASIGKGEDGKPAPVIVVHNDSSAHGYVSRNTLSVTERDAQGKPSFQRTYTPAEIQQMIGYGLIGPGQRRSLILPISLPSESGSVEAKFLPEAH
jgi:fimbrial chaperone protein